MMWRNVRRDYCLGQANAPPRRACPTIEDTAFREVARRHSRQIYVTVDLRATQSTICPRIWRAMTSRWISLVPSPISHTLASRIMRSTGYSVV